ncbi:sn-glycerol-1-phosphate dehydrogenase (plasmid) [Pedobacter sp. BS3]|uniref:sn-glycerol-1-phosphate dehydrogenase n=1 Tax=Pedobacter sp. BS3 TaxID=2567937 RepID=UPI0011EBB38F|nr:sn-glycerol-1-phosphate dehydrogenase [Pedobacter sp. BS3]TZF86283.1 sn-glycerol-1-phosphate dehydrogenase [Pedobacter sp. BS3]
MSKVETALKAASETKALIIGRGVLKQAAQLFKAQFPGKKAIIVADTITFGVAGETVSKQFESEDIDQENPYIYSDPEIYAEYSYVDELVAVLKNYDAIPVAVGSGTINDLTKLASHLTGRPYMCVATAASMDGYTAFGASITANGAKQTFNCPAPQACLADIDILSAAPAAMTASGYADLFAKITAGADWILADALQVEAIDPTAWSIVQDGLHEALSDPKGTKNGDPKAVTQLTEGLMLGGFAMQWSKSSRPASGAEHQFSHLWNMEHHLNNGEHVSHGFQVSIGTLAITALYGLVLKTPFENLDIQAALKQWPTLNELKAESLAIFKDTDFPEIGLQETTAKYIDHKALEEQLQILKDNWSAIKERLARQIVPFEEAKSRLATVGAPTEPEHIGITRKKLKETFVRAQYIRRRFTILDLAVRTGYLDQWLDQLFGKGGIWEVE